MRGYRGNSQLLIPQSLKLEKQFACVTFISFPRDNNDVFIAKTQLDKCILAVCMGRK